MSAALEAVLDYVRASTTVFRKGEVVSRQITEGGLEVITIDAFPALPEGARTVVDCHFVTIGFTEHLASLSHREFFEAVLAAREGAFANMNLSDWAGGPSYIAVGAWIGDQTDAFRFMACVQAHGLGTVITPARLHITDPEQANLMAGAGYIMLSGLTEPPSTTPPSKETA